MSRGNGQKPGQKMSPRRNGAGAPSSANGLTSEAEPVVIIIDDDPTLRGGTERMIRAAGFTVQAFGSPKEFLRSPSPAGPACLVLDFHLPGLSGFDLQRDLATSGFLIPVIFITSHGDIRTSVQAMKAGAVEFLARPFPKRHLLDAINVGIERDRLTRKVQATLTVLRESYESLTPRQ